MDRGSCSHCQRVADADRHVADPHRDQDHRTAVLFREAQSFFNGTSRGRIQLMGDAFAHHALGVGIDLNRN
jgi:hypothetical protein